MGVSSRILHIDDANFESFNEGALEGFERSGFSEITLELARKNGTKFPCSILTLPIFNSTGELSRIALIIKDQSQERRFESEKKFIVTRLKELAAAISQLGDQFGVETSTKRLSEFDVSVRQTEIARCVLNGLSNKEIARALNLSESSVKVHIYTLYKRLGVRSRVEFVQFLRDKGIRID
jgi:DNA-binding CsgD family transcriptional regulator